MESLSKVLNDDNRALLRVIADTAPPSIVALSKVTGSGPADYHEPLEPWPITAW